MQDPQQPPSGDRKLDELSSLYRLATLRTTEGPNAVIDEFIDVVHDLIPCRYILVLLWDEDADRFDIRGEDRATGLYLTLDESEMVRRCFLNHTPEISNDLKTEAGTYLFEQVLHAHQAIMAPLASGGTRIGVAVALDSERGAFTDADLRRMAILADRAAATVENARLIETLGRQVNELDGLQRLTRLLIASESLEYVIGESLRIVSELVSAEKMAVLIYNEQERVLEIEPPAIGLGDHEIENLRIPLDKPSLGATVFRTNTALVSNDASNDAWVSSHFRELLGIDTILVAPLATGTRPIGIIKAINAEKGKFEEEDMRYLTLLGAQVGSVIQAGMARDKERALVKQLRETDRTKTEFVSMLAHELRGPMTTVMGFASTLQDAGDKLTPEKQKEILGIVNREVTRLSRMVGDLLDVSRMEAGTLRYEFAPVALPDLLENLLQIHTSLKTAHVVDTEVPNDLPKVLADRDRLSQVFLNLLTNASRYSPEGTMIKLTVEHLPQDGVVRVGVHDEGIGIAPGDADRIFEKFAMLPKPVWVKKGTGLGLFITKGIIDAHRGRIWVESEVGKGSTFFFTLPTASDTA